jgi:hypothetical protein
MRYECVRTWPAALAACVTFINKQKLWGVTEHKETGRFILLRCRGTDKHEMSGNILLRWLLIETIRND